MLAAVRPYASPHHALVTLPGPEGGYGREVDGLEGFARTFLLAGFRVAGERGGDDTGLLDRYAEGLAAGSDPSSPERWVRLDEHPQAKVEAASIALVLDLTRPWLWDRLAPRVQRQVVEYLSPAVGDDTYPRINWVWFRLVVQTFLRSVGGPWSATEMREDLATHDSFVREDGWLADGSQRSFDHYSGWALHLYPTLWARMAGAEGFAAPRRIADTALLDRYLQDALHLVGADGSPLVQGRSLTYRFAAAAPFWVGALAGVPAARPGLLRRAASGVVRHFVERGVPDERGLLPLGWHHAWPRIAQSYSGPGSPYWASKGFLGLTMPADHPVWTADEEPLPVERGDTLRTVRAPGWIISGTHRDGVVRVVNHATDHASPGDDVGDSPLYARLGYSTASSPLLDPDSWTDPLDQAVVLLDEQGRATHRSGMRLIDLRTQETDGVAVALATSVTDAHWLAPASEQRHHGSGLVGTTSSAGRMAVVSLVRGPWEVRIARVDPLAPDGREVTGIRFAGWAVAGADAAAHRLEAGAAARARGVTSLIIALSGAQHDAGVQRRTDASPLGDPALVPWVTFPAQGGNWAAVLIELSGAATPPELARSSSVVIVEENHETEIGVSWPDSRRTCSRLIRPPGRDQHAAPAGVVCRQPGPNNKEQR
jgi:hypothetical protein